MSPYSRVSIWEFNRRRFCLAQFLPMMKGKVPCVAYENARIGVWCSDHQLFNGRPRRGRNEYCHIETVEARQYAFLNAWTDSNLYGNPARVPKIASGLYARRSSNVIWSPWRKSYVAACAA